jgi:acetyltransferase-like isoleucine patch superfamily enzyme
MSHILPEKVGNVHYGRECKFGNGVQLIAKGHASIELGDRCHLKSGTILNAYGGHIRVMDRVTFGEYCVVYGHGGIDIGSGTAIAPHVVISAQEHIVGSDFPIRFSGETAIGIHIGENCLISARTVVLDGVNIGDHCVIGAGAVVTKSMPAAYICFGVPCRPISKIERNSNYGITDESR